MDSGVRVVDLSLYVLIRDTQRTSRLNGRRAPVSSIASEQGQPMLMAQSVRLAAALVTLAMAFMMMVSGFAVVVLRVLLREQTIPRLAPQRLTLNEILIRALERSESLTTTEHSDHFCVQAVHC
jgi:hypothetical protein